MTYVVEWATKAPSAGTAVGDNSGERCVRIKSMVGSPFGGVAVTSAGAVVVSDVAASAIRWVDGAGAAAVVGGRPGFVDGPAADAGFRRPLGVTAGPAGGVVVADTGNSAIRTVSPEGTVTTLAGGVYGRADGPAATARFAHPEAVAMAADGSVVVADTGNNLIRRIKADGQVATLAGGIRGQGGPGRGPLSFREPTGVVVDPTGVIYVADTGNHRICRVQPSGQADVVAGWPPGGLADGRAEHAAFRWPAALALASDGTLYVADVGNGLVRRVSPDGSVDTVGGEPGWQPVGLSLFGDGCLVVAEIRWQRPSPVGRVRAMAVGASQS